MLGYCSNSPLRCTNARTMHLLNEVDGCCPECHLFLLPAQNISHQLKVDERFLRSAILAIAFTLLITVYIYYKNFV